MQKMPSPVKLRLYPYKEFYFISNDTVKQVYSIYGLEHSI